MTPSPTAEITLVRTAAPTETNTDTPTIAPTDTFTATATPTTTLTVTPEPFMLTQTAAAILASTQQTPTQTATGSDLCETDWQNQLSVQVFDPEYSPKHLDPPLTIVYGTMPFLIRWQVQNTSKTCTWNAVKLQTPLGGQNKILTLMEADHVQPYINMEFALRDKVMNNLTQVKPGQTVVISIQIDGYALVDSGGKIDRTCDLIVNGHLLPAGTMKASLATWVIVQLPTTSTPTSTSPSGGPPQTNATATIAVAPAYAAMPTTSIPLP